MDALLRFKINKPKVISEIFDDEVVVINLDSGNYYSLGKLGVRIWGLIEKGANSTEIAEIISCDYQFDGNDLNGSIVKFINELEREQLILPDLANNAKFDPGPDISSGANKPIFEEPVLSKYTDMQELLLLDPIHDVDESGWPSSK